MEMEENGIKRERTEVAVHWVDTFELMHEFCLIKNHKCEFSFVHKIISNYHN